MASCERNNQIEEIIKLNVKEMVKDSLYEWFISFKNKGIYDGNFDDYYDSIFRIQSKRNYYHVWFCGVMCDDFIFNKEGKLLFKHQMIHELDDKNFICFDYNLKRNVNKVYHFRMPGECFDLELVNSFDNFDNVEAIDFFSRDGIVIFSYGDNNMLYNYNNGEVLIPSYSEISFDLGNFNQYINENEKSKYMRVIKNLYGIENYRTVLDSQLEFLVDKYGRVASVNGALMEIYDFMNKNDYALVFDNISQECFLNGIYKKVWNINNQHRKKILVKNNK